MMQFLDALGTNEVYLDEMGVLAKAREVDAEIARLRAERDYAARVGNATAEMMQEELQQARAERDALAFRVSALREGLQDVLGVDPRSDAMWFIADNALKVDDDRARQALTSMERGQCRDGSHYMRPDMNLCYCGMSGIASTEA